MNANNSLASPLISVTPSKWGDDPHKGDTMAIVEEGEYKGNVMLVLKNTEEDRWPFQFGLKKAKLIIEHINDIKKFVEKHDKDKVEEK